MTPEQGDVSFISILQWAFDQGSLLVLLVVIGYFYRKDFLLKVEQRGEVILILTNLVKQNQEFNEHQLGKHSALTEHSIAVHAQVSGILAEQSASMKVLTHELIEQRVRARGRPDDSGDSRHIS